jgi:hypothetical protein
MPRRFRFPVLTSARDLRDTDVIKEIDLDELRPGETKVRQRFAKLKPGMTVDEAVKVGVSKYDLAHAIDWKRIVIGS